jgi:hypothetical protein
MDSKELASYLDDALKGLKDFQRASVDALHEGLYEDNRPRMLLADEVGLGKTVVARGLIARLIKKRIATGMRKPLKVTYICSNQVIAGENIRKLNPFPPFRTTRRSASRIAYLARPDKKPRRGEETHLLEINTLTPATSFQLSTGVGNKWERRLIYRALCRDLKMRRRRDGLGWLLKGPVRKMRAYQKELEESLNKDLREGFAERFISTLKRRTLPLSFTSVYANIPGIHKRSIYDALADFLNILDGNSHKKLREGCRHLSRLLRECFVDCCLRYVNADLYILDEFQRFRDLIDEDSESEQSEIARRIFTQGKKTRVLMLSATPFKAFTGQDDAELGEDHYKDFRRVLKFLLSHEEDRIQHYETHRKALYSQILDLRSGTFDGVSSTHRDEVQSVLRAVICRTERHSVSADPNALIADVWKHSDQQVPFSFGDIENFRLTDRIARALNRVNQMAGTPVEYCKSAIYPLSFLERYKLKEELKNHQLHPEVQKTLLQNPDAWLDFERIDSYEWSIEGDRGGAANARLSMLLNQAVGPHGAKLLWVPPSLPYYELEDAFGGTAGFSKTLLFSSWVMVPRMVSTLISYEVEKRTIGHPATVESTEGERRTYFASENRKKKRHPIPQIRYQRRSQERGGQLANMSNFTLLYPSQALVETIDPLENLRDGLSLNELRKITTDRIREMINATDLARFSTPNGEPDRWYWAAPLLFDLANEDFRAITAEWFANPEGMQAIPDAEAGDEEDESGAKRDHFDFLRECFENPSRIGLGPIPENLPEILADLALGAPAIVTLRSLRRIFSNESTSLQMKRAFTVADQFCSLFNKPESIAAVRLSEKHAWYWQMVADYCGSGCLQSVLDEYFHLLCEQEVDSNEVIAQLRDAINLNASVINVDSLESFQKDKARKFRCHYAVEFGSQRVETDQGQNRAKSLRKVFNSPFRPFLLSTTSIGQEGLDFHSYCRRIVHWNLPTNPVDLEQREGRINRYKSLVIRQQVAKKYRPVLANKTLKTGEDAWQKLFQIADLEERQKTGKSELVPFWHIDADPDDDEAVKIERVIPLYPFSIDHSRLQHILKTLAIYRLAFGQPRQAELVDHLLKHNLKPEELHTVMDKLMINLSPIHQQNKFTP